MYGPLRVLTFVLSIQTALAKLHIRIVESAGPENDENGFGKPKGYNAGLWKTRTTGVAQPLQNNIARVKTGESLMVGNIRPNEHHELLLDPEHSMHRELFGIAIVAIVGFVVVGAVAITAIIALSNSNKTSRRSIRLDINSDGEAEVELEIEPEFLNEDETGLCPECSLEVEAGECLEGDCENYNQDASNNLVPSVHGDPHMVGFLGQKFDWAGKDNKWYCLIFDGFEFQVNVRITAPMPKEFPDRQLVSAVSIITQGHSLVVEVKNPYTIETGPCTVGDHGLPCLANGALQLSLDGETLSELQYPGEVNDLPGDMTIFAANLPAECQPFGGDRIWAAQYAEIMRAAHRSLRSINFSNWILEADTLAAPTWCEKFLNEKRLEGLLRVQSNHAIFRVQTPTATLRINFGINHQDLVTGPDGHTVIVPQLEFWQGDIGVERRQFSQSVGGMLGETTRLVYDASGIPVMNGLEVLSRPVESYEVSGPLGEDIEQLYK